MTSHCGKIRALNRILSVRNGNSSGKFEEVSKAIDFAEKNGDALKPIGDFAKSVMKMYDESACLEFVDINSDYFDPIFAINQISDAAKRLAGHKKPVLVVAGMDKSAMRGGKNWSQKKREEYFAIVFFQFANKAKSGAEISPEAKPSACRPICVCANAARFRPRLCRCSQQF